MHTNLRTNPDTIAGLLAAAADRNPDRTAVIIGERRLTYRELQREVDDMSFQLIALGLRPGDRVGVLSPNSAELLLSYFAISSVRCISVPLNHRSTPDELAYAVAFADVTSLFVRTQDWRGPDDATDLVSAAIPGLEGQDPLHLDVRGFPKLGAVVLFDAPARSGFASCADLRLLVGTGEREREEVVRRVAALDRSDDAMLMFTSGTTARPKGVVQTNMAMARTSMARWEVLLRSHDERVWVPTPLCHSGALLLMLGAIGQGFTFLTEPFFEAETAADTLLRENVTTLWPQFPAIIQDLSDVAAKRGITFDAARQVAVVQTRACFEQTAGLFPNAVVLSGYGSTELNGFISAPALDSTFEHRLSTCGRPFAGIELSTLDVGTGRTAGTGEVGEIVVRGLCVFREYYNDPVATAAAIDAEGWFHTGDLGVIDDDGELTLAGRKKDFLKVGGVNVSPAEIEARLLQHPSVRTAEVVGAPDQRLDEVPVAFVENEPGCVTSEEELIEFCRARLATFKIPRRIHWVEAGSWPMSLTKVDKNELRRRAASMIDPGGVSPDLAHG